MGKAERMYTVDIYAKVRRMVMVEGQSERSVARLFGIHRTTVRKMLEYSVPPGYRRKVVPVSPKLGPYIGVIEEMLAGDRQVHKKQRHTAQRILERLREEHGFRGGYTIVREYVARWKQTQREMFIPLSHAAGHAQVDFGEADVYLGGQRKRVHFFCLDLPHSDGIFIKAYLGETTEAFLDGHVSAFAWLGGVPRSILYDNTTLAVAKIEAEGVRRLTRAFNELSSHYLFEPRFGRPGKGNDKGKVEGLVGYGRRHFFVPLPRVDSIEELNRRLLEACSKRQVARLRGHQESIAERMVRDREHFLPLPSGHFEACEKVATRVSSLSLVRYRTNDYSVPSEYGHREVLVKGFVDRVVISTGGAVIATHPRSYEREQFIYNPLHYLRLLERKPNALDQAAPLQGWPLPESFDRLRRLLEVRMGKRGRKEYIQVLRLVECFGEAVLAIAVEDAMKLGAVSFDAVKHLALCRLERRPAKLNMEIYPYLPRAEVALTEARSYLALLHPPSAVSLPAEGVR